MLVFKVKVIFDLGPRSFTYENYNLLLPLYSFFSLASFARSYRVTDEAFIADS